MNYRLIALILLASVLITRPPAHAQDNTPIDYDELNWSPDGTHLAYSSQEDIWVYDFATGEHHNLTGDVEGLDGSPVWSPDSTQIVFASTREMPPLPEDSDLNNLWLMNADGTNPINLTNTADFSYTPAGFSADGNYLLINAALWDFQTPRLEISVVLMDLRDLTLKTISPPDNVLYFHPSFSPDNQHIVFSSHGETFTTGFWWRVDYHDGQTTPATMILSEDGAIEPAYTWSPDSCCVAYAVMTLNDDLNRLQFHLKGVNVETGLVTPLTSDMTGNQVGPFWSPDGSKIGFRNHDRSQNTGTNEYWVINPDGTDPTLIPTSMAGFKDFGIWSPDGQQIGFINRFYDANGSPLGSDIWVINADGSNPQNLTGNFH